METHELSKDEAIRNQLIAVIERNSDDGNYWKSVNEITQFSGLSAASITKLMRDSEAFVRNRKGNYSTRRLYRKYTPVTKKFYDAYVGKIN